MHFSNTLIICLLLHHPDHSSGGSISTEKTIIDEKNILGRFFSEAELFYKKYNPRQVIVLGASADQLDQVKPLLEAFPYSVGRDAKKFCGSGDLGVKVVVIYFLASLEREYLNEVVRELFGCKENRVLFIFEDIEFTNVHMELLLHVVIERMDKLPVFIHHSKTALKCYGGETSADCSKKLSLQAEWVPGGDMNWLKDWQKRIEYSECPKTVGTMHYPPWMHLAEDANGTVRIVGGFEAKIISTIAQKLNFTLVVQRFEPSAEDISHRTEAIVSSCAAGKTTLGIAHIRPTLELVKAVHMTSTYSGDYLVWCVPKITKWKGNIVSSEFAWTTWVLVGLTFLASFAIEKMVRNTRHLNRGNTNRSESSNIILDLIGATVGNPIAYQPLAIGGKLLLIIYLSYSTVISTAYKTSLSSILTVENHESVITDVEGIFRANLTMAGGMTELAILKNQAGEYAMPPVLLERYVIEPNISRALRRISNDKDFAYLTSRAELAYHLQILAIAGESLSCDVLDRSELTYGIVMIVPKSSQLHKQINEILQRLDNGGFIQYWGKIYAQHQQLHFTSTQSSETMNTEKNLHRYTRDKFYYIFWLYVLALTFCFLAFLGELAVHRFKLADKFQRLINVKRTKLKRCITL